MKKIEARIKELNYELSKNNFYNSLIRPIEDLNGSLKERTAREIVENAFLGEYNAEHLYFFFDTEGHIVTLGEKEIEGYIYLAKRKVKKARRLQKTKW